MPAMPVHRRFPFELVLLSCLTALRPCSAEPLRPSELLTPPLQSGIARSEVEQRSYLSYVTESLDNLMQFGTDRYGSVQSDLLVSNLDVTTRNNPPSSQLLPADEAWRAERRERRAPGGANFLHNQSVYTAMKRASHITGNASYANFVDSNLSWATSNLVDGNNLFWWGYHRHYDVHTEQFVSDPPGGGPHEMHFIDGPWWEGMWEQNPTAVRAEIQAIWDRHVVDKSTGEINRHDGSPGLSFITSSASFIDAFAFLSTKVPRHESATWINRAALLANYNWEHRHPDTGLVAHTPNESQRWDGARSTTTIPGVYVPALLRAYEYTGQSFFREQALSYLTSWAEHAYDPSSGSFWASLELDGTPVEGPWAASGYEQYEPRGLVDLWAPEFITAQYTPDTAKIYAKAHEFFGDPALLDTAEKWAHLIRQSLPASRTLEETWYRTYSTQWAPYGTYAEHYGHTIDFFVTLFEQTGEEHYLFSARDLAREAVSSLWYEGLFRGHPNKPYYEAIDGVGLLLDALLDLDQHANDFAKFGDFNSDGVVDLRDYAVLTEHWLMEVDPYADGDVNGDGIISLADFSRFKYEHFEGDPAVLDGASLVPEPSMSSIVVTLIAAVYGARYRKRSLARIGRARRTNRE